MSERVSERRRKEQFSINTHNSLLLHHLQPSYILAERPFKIMNTKEKEEEEEEGKRNRYPAKVSASFSACVFYSVC